MPRAMVENLYDNRLFYVIALIWLSAGVIVGNLAIAVVIGTVLLLMQKRMYLELFLGFLLILVLSDSREAALQFAKPVRDFYIVLLALMILVDKNFRPLINITRYFIPFFVVAAVCLYFSLDPQLSFLKTLSYLLILFVIPNFMKIIYEEYGDLSLKYLIYFGFLLLVMGLSIVVINPDMAFLAGRFRGVFGNPNGLGIFFALFLILLETIHHFRPTLFKPSERYLFIGLVVVSMLLSGSRTAMFTVFLFYFFRMIFKISKPLSLVALVFIIYGSQVIIQVIPEIVQSLNLQQVVRIDSVDSISEAGGRTIGLDYGWNHVQDSFWLGKGFAFNEYIYGGEFGQMLRSMGHEGGTHNSYLSIWLDTGLIGLILFLLAWGCIFTIAARRTTMAIPIVFSVSFMIFFEAWLAASLNAFTIVFLIIITLMLILDYEETETIEQT